MFGYAKIKGNTIILNTKYNGDMVDELRRMRNRRWNSSLKVNILTINNSDEFDDAMHLINKYNIEYDKETFDEFHKKLIETERQKEYMIKLSKATDYDNYHDYPLYPFQRAGVRYIEETGGRCLIADDMGLGKTIQSLVWLDIHKDLRPVLIVCPSSVKYNWMQEIKKWIKTDKIRVLKSRKDNISFALDGLLGLTDFYIVNWDILADWYNTLKNIDFKVLILDESHKMKNMRAKRTKAAMSLSRDIKHILMLTGTPILNRVDELWSTIYTLGLNELHPSLKNYTKFKIEYSYNRTNLYDLQRILRSTCMVRRMKRDVLTQLPEKVRSIIPIYLSDTQRKQYTKAYNNLSSYVHQMTGEFKDYSTFMTQVDKLKHIVAEFKLDYVYDFVNDVIEEEKIIVFAHHKEIVSKVYDRFMHRAVKIIGGMDSESKQNAINRFYEDKYDIAVVSLRAGGEGINLQCASKVLFVELGWSPGEHTQAEDRAHRIGQKDTVNAYYMLGQKTIDELIYDIICEKANIINMTVNTTADSFNVTVKELFRRIKQMRWDDEV